MATNLYTTLIPAGRIGEKELTALVNHLATITKSKVIIEYEFRLSTENGALSEMLDAFADALPGANANGHQNGKSAAAPEMGRASLRFVKTGEVISTRMLNKRLAAGDIEDMTAVVNAKGQALVIMSNGDGKLKLVKEPLA